MIQMILTMSTGIERRLKFHGLSTDAPYSVRHAQEVESVTAMLDMLATEKLIQLSGDNILEEAATFEDAFYINPQQVVSVSVTVVKEN